MIEQLRVLVERWRDTPDADAYGTALDRCADELAAILDRCGWVSVEERLPETYTTVLVWRKEVPSFVGPITAFWTGEMWTKDVQKGPLIVTHWMAIPAAPKEVEGE